MTVKLEATIRRYNGTSRDDKPQSPASDPVPAGSTFLETDTGHLYRFDGQEWTKPAQGQDLMPELVAEQRRTNELLELVLTALR